MSRRRRGLHDESIHRRLYETDSDASISSEEYSSEDELENSYIPSSREATQDIEWDELGNEDELPGPPMILMKTTLTPDAGQGEAVPGPSSRPDTSWLYSSRMLRKRKRDSGESTEGHSHESSRRASPQPGPSSAGLIQEAFGEEFMQDEEEEDPACVCEEGTPARLQTPSAAIQPVASTPVPRHKHPEPAFLSPLLSQAAPSTPDALHSDATGPPTYRRNLGAALRAAVRRPGRRRAAARRHGET